MVLAAKIYSSFQLLIVCTFTLVSFPGIYRFAYFYIHMFFYTLFICAIQLWHLIFKTL
uniref:Uncharacterized protein n=1 Tax=Arundo donax TaxID=35708 RepID=A0A0A9A5B7_ARUDO